MIKPIVGIALALLSTACLWASPVSLQLTPSSTHVSMGDTVTLDVVISGLGSPGAMEVGSFDMFIGFNPALFVPTGVTFTNLLGDPALSQAITLSANGNHWSEAADVSLLSNADLDGMQPSSFTLATFSFDALSNGTANFSYLGGPIDNGDGELIAGTKEFTPEPSTLALTPAGIFALICFSWRRVPARGATELRSG